MQTPRDHETVRLPRPVQRWVDYGTEGLRGPELRQRRTLNAIAGLVPMSGLSYAALYLGVDAQELWPAAGASLLFCLFAAWPRIAARSELAAWLFGATLAVGVQGLLVWLLGRPSGLHLYFLSAPVIAVVCFGTARIGLLLGLCLICAAAMLFTEMYLPAPAPFITVDERLLNFLQTSVFVVVTGFVTLGVYVGFAHADRAERALEIEYARSEDLLYSLLPREIAARLKADPHATIADTLPNVAIVFADIANFTPMSRHMAPEALVDLLNGIFRTFDRLADGHDLEKIKTIGDAYMVAAGMPNAVGDPAQRAANMALDMLEVVRASSVDLPEGLQLRIGMHVGPVVAGVIGTRKLFYDVWGETVNTASRMESMSAPGRILVTPAAHGQLGTEYVFEERGEIEVKGIGPIRTWWLTGRA
ncbi:adenylate/guanylate cyclase domain-containing protein [Gymnodinialimonas ulvae]|uniref:adenylate/guanylate cyclase domain-containing protein n=1 Tax=Gymnodinialimonas ulvae TaxID=3126504 RepID=UPI0030B56FC5